MLKERPGTITNRWKRGGIILKTDPIRKEKSENVIYVCLLHHMLHLYPRLILVVNIYKTEYS